jgi:hypothetical protein
MKSQSIIPISFGVLAALTWSIVRSDEPPTPTSQPAAASTEPEPPHEPTAAEILRELSRDENAPPRPVVRPTRPGQTNVPVLSPDALPKSSVIPPMPKLYPDGYRIVDRAGRLTREGDYYTYSFETRTEGAPDLPIRLLPNRLLEDMEVTSAGGAKPIVFIVSGELTEYHGVNYLLIQKLLTRPNLGNFK